ncbi:MAG: dTDP-4-dehydrorhamnose reductase [Candidatus Nanopelagicales bacterium]
MSAAAGMRWVVVGANGMLGTEVMSALAKRDVRGLDLPDIDITDPASVEPALAGVDVVVNCAAYTAVDDAETNEGIAFLVNAIGPANLARQCAKTDAILVQISTDYVFDGAADQPYSELIAPSPRSAYGRTKLAGEWAVRAELPQASYILRTAWLYGAAGPNFAATMARLERERDTVTVVDDQFGQPTWARDLAQRIVETVDVDAPVGIYHATNAGRTSWFGFARRVFELAGADPDRVQPTTTDAFPRPAPRPANSVLSHARWERAGLLPMRPWDEALTAAWASGLVDDRSLGLR